MCFFGAFRYIHCGHTDFQIVVFCRNFTNPATFAGNSSTVPGAPCMPRLPDPQRGDMGNVIQYNVVLPDNSRQPTASYLPSQGLQQADGHDNRETAAQNIPTGNPCPISGFCANCTATAQSMAQIHDTQPNFGLSSEYILDANRMNTYFQYVNGNGNGNTNNHDNFGTEQLSTLPSQVGHTYSNVDPMLMGTTATSTNAGMNAMNVDMAMLIDPRILNSNADAMNTNMHRPSMFGLSGQNGYQSGAVNVQQQPQSLYHANYTQNGYPISSTNGYSYNTTATTTNNNSSSSSNGNGYGNGNGDNTLSEQYRPRGRIVRTLSVLEDPFVTDNSNGQPVPIPRLFQNALSSNTYPRDKRVRFEEPEDSNLPAYTPSRPPSKYRPSRLEAQALKLRKSVRRTAVAAATAATAARINRAPPAPPTTEAQATAADTGPRQRAGAMQRLSERWQAALRSRARSSASASDTAVKTEKTDKDEGEDVKDEGDDVKAEGDDVKAEGDDVKDEGDDVKAEGDDVKAEGDER